jgi:WXG100 family type VII secretion target
MSGARNMSNEGSGGSVRKLDTKSFNDAITAYANSLSEFQRIINSVNSITNTMVSTANWRGKGRNAFDNDCRQVRINLNDVNDIMHEIRDALINARDEYARTDDEVSNHFKS